MNNGLEKNIDKIIIFFIMLSPVFDLFTSLFIHVYNTFNFIIVIKILFMFLLIYYVLFISKLNRKKILIYYLLLFIYSCIYLLKIVITKDMNVLSYEIPYLFRTLFLPICLVSLSFIYKEKKTLFNYKYLNISFLIYLILLVIPIITNTSFNSYDYSKVGSIGWFNSTNEIGAIISILYTIFMIKNSNKTLKIFVFCLYLFIVFSIGSKVPVIMFFINNLFLLIIYLKKHTHKIKLFIIPAVLILSFLIYAIPKTNFYKNIIIHLNYLEVDSIIDLLNYENIDHFIFSSRLKFLNQTTNNFIDSKSYLIGLGYIENYGTDKLNVKTIEMDYFDIFYRNGIIGFTLFFIPIIYLILKMKKENYLEIYLVVMSLILSLFQGHVLVSPSVSIFLIIIILIGGEYEKLLCNS